MRCPNCATEEPPPLGSDNGTTTCPVCGHRFPIEEPALGSLHAETPPTDGLSDAA